MKSHSILRTAWAVVAALALVQATQASLIHRYSFNETSGTTVEDSVGTADGVIKGLGAAFDGVGQLLLPGGGNSADDPVSGYVDLPNHIINIHTNLTIETWVTYGGSGAWGRIFDLGTSDGGEDLVTGNGNYLFLSPNGNVNLRFAVRDPATGTEPVQLTAATPLDIGIETCVTVTYDYTANVCRLYSNGVAVVTGPASVALSTINDVNNWLGRSQWNDPMFQGSYNEFRIYDSALTPVEVAASYASGVANPSTDPAALGTLQAVNLVVSKTALFEGDKQESTTTADFAKASGVPLAGASGVTYQSDTPSVASVDAKGLIDAVSAGTANISVSYLGKSDSVSITVSRRQEGLANAGTLYVDLRAADASTDAIIWKNRVTGQGDFSAEGTPTYVANVQNTGVAGVQFAGTDAYLGPNSNPDLDGGSDRTIEVWTFNPAVAAEETLVAWGHRGGPARSNMSFNYGANASYGAVGHWDEDVGWNGAPVAGTWHYLAYTFDGINKVKVYADGVLKNTRTYAAALDTYAAYPIRIGAQADTVGDATDFGQSLSGYIGLIRVHGGILSDNDIKNNFFYGMELTPIGELQGINLKLATDTVIGIGGTVQASVLATYANRNYLYVNGFSSFVSSDPAVATVDAAGVVTTKTVGTVDITATYQGKTAVQTLKILGAPPAKLVHRYSFGESVGSTTVKDSVGTADGIVKGEGAAFDGAGQLTVPGGPNSAADPPAGYVDLPNHIINVLTNASFEAWVTWDGPGMGLWQRIFDFGTSAGGEDIVDGNGAYLFLSPNGSVNTRFAVRDPATGTEPVVDTASQPLPIGTEVYVAVTYDYSANASVLYSNAVRVAGGPASVALGTINDVNNWLGRSQWADAMFQGKYNEFRIWDGALTPEEVAASLAAGPDKLPEPPVSKPTLTIVLSGANVVISWPSAATGFVLESTTALGPGMTWSPVDTTGAVEQGGQKSLTVPIEGTAKFYRMRK
jgi:hypothetical protein